MTPSTRDIELACRRLLPKGWSIERFETEPFEYDGFSVVVRNGGTVRRFKIPDSARRQWSVDRIFDIVEDAIARGLQLGRYTTTPILPIEKEWSPYS